MGAPCFTTGGARYHGVGLIIVLSLFAVCARAADDAEFSAGGFALLSVISGGVSEDRDQPGDVRLHVPSIPVSGVSPDFDRLSMHAKDSRGWVRGVVDSPLGELEMLIEGDLAETPRRYDFRLRHAYLRLGRLTVGQTWSTFTNTSSLANVEAGFALGNMLTRHDVIQWKQPLDTVTGLTVALEEPLNRLQLGSSRIQAGGEDRRPDLVLRVDRRGDWGNVSASMAVREIATTGQSVQPGNEKDSETAVAFSLAGRLETGGADNLRFTLSYGDALARYLTSSIYADAVVSPNGEVRAAAVRAGTVAWQHFWSPRWRTNVAANYSRTQASGLGNPALTRQAASTHLNLIWTPDTRVSLGVEYVYAWREAIGGKSGDLNRLQWTARYNF